MKLLTGLRTILLLTSLIAATCAQAYTITVNTAADEDLAAGSGGTGCSLREAFQLRFNNDGVAYNQCTASGFVMNDPVTINFNADYTGAGSVEVDSPLNIPGGSLGSLTVDGSGHVVHISCAVNPGKIFVEANDANFTLSNVLMDGCTAAGAGIAIDNTAGGRLTITNVTFDNFHSNSGSTGGAVAHYSGVLTITNSNFTNNGTADTTTPTPDLGDGGALYISSISGATPSTLTNVTFTSNSAGNNGGALYYGNPLAPPYSLLLTNVTFTTNTANGHTSNAANSGGGAIYEDQDGGGPTAIFLISNSLFTGNTAPNGSGGAIVVGFGSRLAYASASAPEAGGVYGSHFTGNTAGGIPDGQDPTGGSGGAIFSRGYLTVAQSSFVSNGSNHASGGAIANADDNTSLTSMIANSTFYTNVADQSGGAVANLDTTATLQLINDTIVNNSAAGTGATPGGGAIYNANVAASSVAASNTIFGASGGTGGNCAGTSPQNVANNLQYSPNAGCGGITVGDPLLSAPAINAPASGAAVTPIVRTMAIGEGSPASRGGDVATCAAGPINNTDATGSLGTGSGVRPTPALTNCDIGAYESGSLTPVDLQSFSVE